ncbi:FliO/MopB family protein [bacterium]|nr:FliO/MopB family protein [bacterium]
MGLDRWKGGCAALLLALAFAHPVPAAAESGTVDDQPPIDLGRGVTAQHEEVADGLLAGGVTAIVNSHGSAATGGDALGQEMLQKRQYELSFAADFDVQDAGHTSVGDAFPEPPPLPDASPGLPVRSQVQEPDPVAPVNEANSIERILRSLPPGEVLVDAREERSLRELFGDNEAADGISDSVILASALIESQGLFDSPANPGEIQPGFRPSAADGGATNSENISSPNDSSEATIGQSFATKNSEGQLGSNIPRFNLWRTFLIFVGVLALAVIILRLVGWLRSGRGGAFKGKLSVIETVGLGPGRQIVIVEMHGQALVLGITPHSINLLDKVPMSELNGNYRGTVEEIIELQGTGAAESWNERPQFVARTSLSAISADGGHGLPPHRHASPAPPLKAGNYGPGGKARMSVGELRRARAAGAAALRGSEFIGWRARSPAPQTATAAPQAVPDRESKTALIEQLRQQLAKLEQ